MVMTWVLVIIVQTYGQGVAVTNITDYPSQESCLESVRFVKAQKNTIDAYCIAKPKMKKEGNAHD